MHKGYVEDTCAPRLPLCHVIVPVEVVTCKLEVTVGVNETFQLIGSEVRSESSMYRRRDWAHAEEVNAGLPRGSSA